MFEAVVVVASFTLTIGCFSRVEVEAWLITGLTPIFDIFNTFEMPDEVLSKKRLFSLLVVLLNADLCLGFIILRCFIIKLYYSSSLSSLFSENLLIVLVGGKGWSTRILNY